MTAGAGLRQLIDWLVTVGLDGTDEQALFHGLCERLNGAGLEFLRGYLAAEVLHPLNEAKGII